MSAKLNNNSRRKHFFKSNGEKKCFFCGKFVGKNATLDHLFPKSKCGQKAFFMQCVLSCEPCNQKKSNRKPTEKEVLKLTQLVKKRLDYPGIEYRIMSMMYAS